MGKKPGEKTKPWLPPALLLVGLGVEPGDVGIS